MVSRKGAEKRKTEGAKKMEFISFAPFALQFLAPLRETGVLAEASPGEKPE